LGVNYKSLTFYSNIQPAISKNYPLLLKQQNKKYFLAHIQEEIKRDMFIKQPEYSTQTRNISFYILFVNKALILLDDTKLDGYYTRLID